MIPELINHPYLTAIRRTDLSVPTRYLLQHNLLKGRILDFGCGFGYDTDELRNRENWGEGAYLPEEIFAVLRELA